MGAAVCAAVASAPDLDLVAAVDPAWAGVELSEFVLQFGPPRRGSCFEYGSYKAPISPAPDVRPSVLTQYPGVYVEVRPASES